ncbi:hypothetical protein ED733_005556 [Metarhizium rileyi]|uniref:Uncharacterized protein n=1 Tax=Metarhizium rileyi (strain RCEF 4871) TaxID=1649241 RepID=A0A5C6G9D0_METRR|nr:hypothetical protein ED733_005556 [Metarhizium rileyi]
MELTRSIIHKRPQPHPGAEPSSPLAQQATHFFPVDSFRQLPFDYQYPYEQDSFSYGQTSSFESHYYPQLEQAPIKRRKLDVDPGIMPLRYSHAELQANAEKLLSINSYEASDSSQQSTSGRWAHPVMPTSQSLAQFPRRVAELMCGGCGGGDHSDGYFPLPEAQPEVYEPSKPYSSETQTMVGSHVLSETSGFPLVGPKGFSHELFNDDPAHAAFPQGSQLQTSSEFIQEGLICNQDTAFSSLFSNQLVKQEHDLLSSHAFEHEALMRREHAQASYGFSSLNASVTQSIQQAGANHSPAVSSVLMLSSGSLIDTVHQESRANTNVQAQQSNFDILMPNQRGGKRVSNTKAGRFPCLRYKITDVRLFKPGQVPGYEWTRRWNNNISDPIQKWASSDVKFIRISTGYSRKCIELRVRKFVPLEGDKLERTWDFEGRRRSVKIPPYALMDLDDGKSAYMSHIRDAMGDTLQHVAERSCGLLRRTYIQAFRMYQDPSIPEDWKQLFDWTFRLWVAIRLSTTSEFIVGEERLGMPENILDETNPNCGKIPVPPVLGAQLDLVLIHHIQTKLRRELLDKLQKMVLKNKQSTWFVSYLVTFILLHNAALITAHDAAYARKHGIRRRFAREDKVKEYHLGANILLAHFHYCNKGWYPFSEVCKDQDLRTLADLDDDKIRFVRATRRFARQHQREWDRLREQGAWENDYFFVSQLFEENWHPRSGA